MPARRVTVDSKGTIWVCEYFGNKIASINPDTGKVTESRTAAQVRQPVQPVA